MTSIGCDCIILVIMNGYVHLGSEGGQYVGRERAAKLVPVKLNEPRSHSSFRGTFRAAVALNVPPTGNSSGTVAFPVSFLSLFALEPRGWALSNNGALDERR